MTFDTKEYGDCMITGLWGAPCYRTKLLATISAPIVNERKQPIYHTGKTKNFEYIYAVRTYSKLYSAHYSEDGAYAALEELQNKRPSYHGREIHYRVSKMVKQRLRNNIPIQP